jgi:hypothetical protein
MRDLTQLYDSDGLDGLALLIAERRAAPGVAYGLEALSEQREIGVLEIFLSEEILEGAHRYLVARRDAPPYELRDRWAWNAIWFGRMPWERRLELTMELADLVRDNDNALWMIGDGPLSEVEDHPAGEKRLAELLPTNPTLARIRQLVEENP